MAEQISLTVNGSPRVVASGAKGADLLDELRIPAAATVAELNGSILPREEFLARQLCDGDVLELVTLVGGG